jgi:hypothetical protein
VRPPDCPELMARLDALEVKAKSGGFPPPPITAKVSPEMVPPVGPLTLSERVSVPREFPAV